LVGPVAITADLGGIHISPGDLTPNNIAGIVAPVVAGAVGNLTLAPTLSTHIQTPTSPPGPGGNKPSLPGLNYVIITLTTVPANANIIYANGSPNVYLGAGWIEFTSGGYCVERSPLQFLQNFCVAPSGADGYAYSVSNGYAATDSGLQRISAQT
jgi:hypothetical protein